MKVSVCYVVRFPARDSSKALGDLRRFMESYKKYSAGADHDLYILVKGPGVERHLTYVLKELPESTGLIWAPDFGYDLGSYTLFAQNFALGYMFVLNQHSEILRSNWLNYYTQLIRDEGAELVGTTASLSSLADPYFPPVLNLNLMNLALRVIRKITSLRFRWRFDSFPNPHIRTNAILVKTSVWLSYFQGRSFKSKIHCYEAESGKDSFFNFICRSKTKARLVRGDRLSLGYWGDWKGAVPFRNEHQNLLIIADNHTRYFNKMPLWKKTIAQKETWR